MVCSLTAGSRRPQAAPSLQRRRVNEPAQGWGTGVPLQVQSADTHWQTLKKKKREEDMNLEDKETRFRYQIIKCTIFHNSTFLRKLCRLSHQTIHPRSSWTLFICVLIRLWMCRCFKCEERALGLESSGVNWVYISNSELTSIKAPDTQLH